MQSVRSSSVRSRQLRPFVTGGCLVFHRPGAARRRPPVPKQPDDHLPIGIEPKQLPELVVLGRGPRDPLDGQPLRGEPEGHVVGRRVRTALLLVEPALTLVVGSAEHRQAAGDVPQGLETCLGLAWRLLCQNEGRRQ